MKRADVVRGLVAVGGFGLTGQVPSTPGLDVGATPFPIPGGTVTTFPARVRVPFIVTDPLPLVAVNVNGTDASFFIDTGAPDIVLDAAFAQQVGVTLDAAGNGMFAGGKRAPVARGIASKVAVGDLRLADVPVTSLPTRGAPFWPGRRADGILGTGFLAHALSTIDYVTGALVLRPRSDSPAFQREAVAAHATIVPMMLVPDHFIFVRGSINDGPEGWLSVDTGLAGAGVMPSRAAVADSHIVLDEAHAGQGVGAAGPVRVVPFTASVTVGGRRVSGVAGSYTPDGDPFGMFPFPVRGAVSHSYFRRCALTFDFEAMRLVMR